MLYAAGLVVTCGCTPDAVAVEDPTLTPPVRTACADLLERLPETLADQTRRKITPPRAAAAAWGDPPILLRCGVGTPRELTPISVCEEVDGVGWFLPEEQMQDPESDLVYTTVGYEPTVSVRVPAAYRSVVTSITVPLADPVREALDLVRPCV